MYAKCLCQSHIILMLRFGSRLLCAGHLPLAFNASSLTPGEHTVHITAKGSNGATATSSLTFQIDGTR